MMEIRKVGNIVVVLGAGGWGLLGEGSTCSHLLVFFVLPLN